MNSNPSPGGGEASYTREVLEGGFEEQLPFYREVISRKKGEDAAEKVIEDAKADFEKLMPEVPYVGDEHLPLAMILIQSAVTLSFYRSLMRSGDSSEQAGDLIVAVAEASMRSLPEDVLLAQGEQQFNEGWYQIQLVFAAKSQEKQFPGDWVFSFVEGVPGEFDWGWDFTACGILKLYKAQGAEELMPYICAQDFIESRLGNTGLQRTKTLAEGCDCCDFRYKQGREVQEAF